jgi:hypothetical protein
MIKKLLIISCFYLLTSISFAAGNNLLLSVGEDKLTDNIERIVVLANPGESTDIYGVGLNISITNGQIIDFTPAEFMSIGTCGDGKRVASNKVCVDFATESGFRDGDELGYITVKWGQYNGKSKIEVKQKNYIGDGAKEFVLSQNTYTYKVYGGIDTSLQRTNLVPFSLVVVLFSGGICVIYFVKAKKGINIFKSGLILILIFSTIVSLINENNVGLSKLPETGTNPFTLSVLQKCTSAPDDILEGSFTDTTKTNAYTVEISLYNTFVSKADSATIYKPTGRTLVTFKIQSSKLASGTKYYIRVKREAPPAGVEIYSSVVYFNGCVSNTSTPTQKRTNTPIPTATPKASPPIITLFDTKCSGGKRIIRTVFSSIGSAQGFTVVMAKDSAFAVSYTKSGTNASEIIAPDGFTSSSFGSMPSITTGTYYVKVIRKSDNAVSLSKSLAVPASVCTYSPTPTVKPPTTVPTIVALTPTVEAPTPTDDIDVIPPTDVTEPTFPPEDPTVEPTEVIPPSDTPDPSDIAELTDTPIPTDTPDVVLISDTPWVDISGTLVIPTPLDPVVCGAIDPNEDTILNLFDFIPFSKVYRRKCTDNYPRVACGPKDTNGDGEIGIIDFIYFARHYYTRVDSCTLTT